MSERTGLVLALAFVVVALCGCGGGGPDMGIVKGTITLDGKPLTSGNITFVPDGTKNTKGPSSSGAVNEQGEFELGGPQGRAGAVVGSHKVVVSPVFAPGMGSAADGKTTGPKVPPAAIPFKYQDLVKTDLTAEVKKGENKITLEMKSQ